LSGLWHTSMMKKITCQHNRNYLHVRGQFHGILIEVQPRNDCVKYSERLRRLHGVKEDCLKWSTQTCKMQLRGRNWYAISCLWLYLGAPCITHIAPCTASYFWWTERHWCSA
jgi:hypothetical protein